MKMYTKIPGWVSPIEAFVHPNLLNVRKILTYTDILDKDRQLKPKQDLIDQGLDASWWSIMQIQSRYERDLKMYDFYKEQTTFDQIMLTSDEKPVSYTHLTLPTKA